MQPVARHRQVGLHFVVQPLGPFPHLAAATPALDGDAALQLQDALPVQLDGELLLACGGIERKRKFKFKKNVVLI